MAGENRDDRIERPWLARYPKGVPPNLDYPDVPLQAYLDWAAEKYPDTIATIFMGGKLTYRKLKELADRFARGLVDLGLKPGDRVALMLPNCPQFVIAFFGTLKAGCVVTAVNPLYMERELEFQLLDCQAKAIVALDLVYRRVAKVRPATALKHVIVTRISDYLPWILSKLYPLKAKREKTWVEIPPSDNVLWFKSLLARSAPIPPKVEAPPADDVALLQYTGGTTGLSKGAMLTHRNLLANALQVKSWLVEVHEGKERMLSVLPFFHVYGMTVDMNMSVVSASTMILQPRFIIADVLKAIDHLKPTLFPGAPTMYVGVINHPDVKKYNLSSITACISGSAPLPVEVQQRFEAMTGAKLVEGYGLTEASPVTHCNPIWEERRAGSIGLPFPDTDCCVMDLETGTRVLPPGEVGELVVRGPQVMKGYWQRPEENAVALRDGWLYTGDLAKMDEDGYFYIVDRIKDMIISGGYNIYPRDVEEVLYEHPKVKEAAIIGVPDEYRGEAVKAFVVLKDGEKATEQEIIDFCRAKMAKYKAPREVEFRSELPKTIVGKVLRRRLAEEERARREA